MLCKRSLVRNANEAAFSQYAYLMILHIAKRDLISRCCDAFFEFLQGNLRRIRACHAGSNTRSSRRFRCPTFGPLPLCITNRPEIVQVIEKIRKDV
jgi:hypothetical protein